MKRFFRKSILLLIVALILTSTVLPCYAAQAKKATADTVSTKTEKVELNVSSDSINLVVDKYIILNADVTGVEKQPTISWKSSDPAVAKVDTNGVVTGVSVGRAIITATAEVDGETLESNYKVNVVTSDNFVKNFLEKNQILSYQYSYVDDYYYTNDKKCWQDNFGYARIYDLAAPYIVLEYDYLRVFFTYEDRDFMVQLWKGQYGYVFYGSEIGIYTKDVSDKEPGMLTFFQTAEEEYWPTMEMTLYHQNLAGEWEREFTRDYDKYWWCTGFKPGHLRQVEPADELRMIAKITFNDAKMAKQFALGLKACGLTRAKNVNSLENDNYYRVKDTVHVRWQDISEAENTMPIKIGAAALFFFNFLALLMAVLFMLGFGGLLAGLFIFII
jgi:hypothetical protein